MRIKFKFTVENGTENKYIHRVVYGIIGHKAGMLTMQGKIHIKINACYGIRRLEHNQGIERSRGIR